MSAMGPLQIAIVARLKATAGVTALVAQRVFDGRAPQGAVKPYIVVGDPTSEPRPTLGPLRGAAETVMLHVFSSYDGNKQLFQILDAVDAALVDPLAPLSVTGWGTVALKQDFRTIMVQDDGVRHAPVRFRAFALEPPPPPPPTTPAIFAGLLVWLKAGTGLFQDAAGTTPAAADGDPIGHWADQSGNGRHATQATTAKKPTRQTNGVTVVRYDVTDDVLEVADAAALTPTTGMTVFLVTRSLTGGAFFGGLFGKGDTDSAQPGTEYGSFYWPSTARVNWQVTDDANNASIGRKDTGLGSLTSRKVFRFVWDGGITTASLKIYENGIRTDDADTDVLNVFAAMRDGTKSLLVGAAEVGTSVTPAGADFEEFVMYGPALGDIDAEILEAEYLGV